TDGLFDPTLLNQITELGYDRSFESLPEVSPDAVAPAKPGGGWRDIRLDPERRAITVPSGVGIDLGGIAKGLAVDATLARLRQLGVTPALVNAGGDLAVTGTPTGNASWSIAVPGGERSWAIPLGSGATAT